MGMFWVKALHGLKCHYKYFSCICCIWSKNRWRWRQYIALHFHHHDSLKCHDVNDLNGVLGWCWSHLIHYTTEHLATMSSLYAVVVSPLPLLNTSIIFGMFMVKSWKVYLLVSLYIFDCYNVHNKVSSSFRGHCSIHSQ